MKNLRILLVDDEKSFREGMEVFLIAQGYTNVRTASNGQQALEMVQKELPEVVLLDLFLPGMNGLQVMKAIHEIDKNIPVLVLTCEADEEYRDITLTLGAYDYLTKPLALSYLFSYLEIRLKERFRQAAA